MCFYKEQALACACNFFKNSQHLAGLCNSFIITDKFNFITNLGIHYNLLCVVALNASRTRIVLSGSTMIGTIGVIVAFIAAIGPFMFFARSQTRSILALVSAVIIIIISVIHHSFSLRLSTLSNGKKWNTLW